MRNGPTGIGVALALLTAVPAAAMARPAGGAPALLARSPYLGVACPRANSIRCDRLGLAVWLARPATAVSATIVGRPLRLHRGWAAGHGTRAWTGYLQPAGLLADGPLRITPDRGRFFWQGSHPKRVRVEVRVHSPGGAVRVRSRCVWLAAGWG
jgi:hypothetical protein